MSGSFLLLLLSLVAFFSTVVVVVCGMGNDYCAHTTYDVYMEGFFDKHKIEFCDWDYELFVREPKRKIMPFMHVEGKDIFFGSEYK